jgi:hypothetical protein
LAPSSCALQHAAQGMVVVMPALALALALALIWKSISYNYKQFFLKKN